jgi:hypothetical protein
VSAPTLWEEGRWSGTRVTRFSILACVLLAAANLAVTGRLGLVFDAGFILLCIGMALAIRPSDFFEVGVLPPILLVGLCTILGIIDRHSIGSRSDGLIQAVISGLAHHSGSLLASCVLSLAVLGIRTRVMQRREDDEQYGYSNLEGSPAPYRVTSAAPEVKSTTVVGNDPHSPESMTASNS